MRKEEAKRLYKAGKIQIHYNNEDLSTLRHIIGHTVEGSYTYYIFDEDRLNHYDCEHEPFDNISIIEISEITEDEELNTPKHYDNSKGTLYKVAKERGWNPYLFDIVKRLERAEKKGEFDTDLEKSINVIKLWKEEAKCK